MKSLLNYVAGVAVLCVLGLDAFGQCGVYLKRASSQIFPHREVMLSQAEDMTGDGIPDLIATGGGGDYALSVRRIFVIPVNADRTIGAPATLEAESSQLAFDDNFFIGHVNNDGLKDVLVYITHTGAIRAFLNNGNGTFTAQPYQTGGRGQAWIGLVDVDVDGINDYVGFTGGVRMSAGNGDGTFDPPVDLPPNLGSNTGDFNGDGKVDFINWENLYINQGNGIFSVTSVASHFPNGFSNIQVRDINGDGKSDVVTGSVSSSGIGILIRTDTGFTRTDYTLGSAWQGYFRLGNFAGSPALDVVYTDWTHNKKAVFVGDGTGNFTRADYVQKFEGMNIGGSHILVDFDGDGKTDIIQTSSTTANVYPFFPHISSFHFLKNVCDRPGEPRIVDFDRSGTTDFSFWESGGAIWGWKSSGSLSEPRSEIIQWGNFNDLTVPGDYDGDGVTDRSVFRPSNGTWYILRSSDGAWSVVPFGLTGDKPAAADYDGDTISDLAVFRPSDGTWHIWYMGTQQYAAFRFGSSGDKPAPADFDGDFKTDIVLYRPSTGIWYYIRSSNGSIGIEQWGISEDKPIPADFDGDAKADIAVYRPSTRTAYVRRSSNGESSGYLWGAAGDIPQIGDWDGDFVADLGMYRPSTSQWWLTSFRLASSGNWGTLATSPTSSILRIE